LKITCLLHTSKTHLSNPYKNWGFSHPQEVLIMIEIENILKKLVFNLFNNLPSLVAFGFHYYF